MAGAYDLGELDQALFMYLEGQDHPSSVKEQRQTLNIFPSQPMHVKPSNKVGMSTGSPASSGSKRASEPSMELGTTRNITDHHTSSASVAALSTEPAAAKETKAVVKKNGNKKGAQSCSEHEGPKTPDPKGYSWEITTIEGGYGLSELFNNRKGVLNGVINGIDVDDWVEL